MSENNLFQAFTARKSSNKSSGDEVRELKKQWAALQPQLERLALLRLNQGDARQRALLGEAIMCLSKQSFALEKQLEAMEGEMPER